MKKVKIVLMATAIFLGIGGAVASKIAAKVDCGGDQQYYMSAQSYLAAGLYGINYYCAFSPVNCTYYRPNPAQPNNYSPCVIGAYTPIH